MEDIWYTNLLKEVIQALDWMFAIDVATSSKHASVANSMSCDWTLDELGIQPSVKPAIGRMQLKKWYTKRGRNMYRMTDLDEAK